MADFIVRVVNDNREPVKGARVGIEFTDPLRGAAHEYTNSAGLASFRKLDEGEIRVYISGSYYGEYRYEDGGEIIITR